MQFKLAKTHRYWWPVTVRMPHPTEAGQIVEQQLRVQFEPLPRDEQLAAAERAAQAKSHRELVEIEAETATRVIRNWDGVVDDEGNHVPFDADLLSQALQQSWFRRAVNEALDASQNGEAARLGN